VGWLRTLQVNRAAKEYARRLPERLKEGWGFSECYTSGQIKSSVTKLGLNSKYIALGYAAFLPEDQFNLLRSEMPIALSYEEAREAFIRYFPLHLWTKEWEPDKTDSMAGGGYDGSD
jgi:hypothetical protein